MNNNQQSSYTRYPPPSRKLIESKKKMNEPVSLPLLCKALTHEAKHSRNFANAKWLFDDLMPLYDSRKNEGGRYQQDDDRLFTNTITTMVRYAATPAEAMHYATLFFKKYNERIKKPSRELIILTNLLFAHTNQPTQQNMEMALNILKFVVQIGVYTLDPSHYDESPEDNHNFANPLDVFTTVSKKVLQHFNLTLSSDKTELVPLGHYSSRLA